MDKIHLREISCQAHIGVTEEERAVAQRILLDLILHLDLETAAQTDDLEQTVDYRQLVEEIRAAVGQGCYALLEALTGAVCSTVLRDDRISMVEVKAYKFPEVLRGALKDVAVEMTRRAADLSSTSL